MPVERGAEIFGLVIDGRIKAGRLDQPFALLVRASNADDAAALDLGDLADHGTDGTSGSGHDDGFARLRLGNVHQAEIGRHAGCPEGAHESSEGYAGKLGHLCEARAGQRIVERPVGEAGIDDIAGRKPVKAAFGHEAEAAAPHGFAKADRRQVGILVAHPYPVGRVEREIDGACAHLAILQGRERRLDQFKVALFHISDGPRAQHPGLVHLCHRFLPFSRKLRRNRFSARHPAATSTRRRPPAAVRSG